jgi:hypothetical protein
MWSGSIATDHTRFEVFKLISELFLAKSCSGMRHPALAAGKEFMRSTASTSV